MPFQDRRIESPDIKNLGHLSGRNTSYPAGLLPIPTSDPEMEWLSCFANSLRRNHGFLLNR